MNAPRRFTSRLGHASAVLSLVAGTALAADLREIARTGQPAPGLPGFTFDAVTDPVLNDAGQVAFLATLQGPGITDANRLSLWTWNAHDPVAFPTLAYRTSFASPDAIGTIWGLGSPAITSDARLQFSARLYTTNQFLPMIVGYVGESAPGTPTIITREPDGSSFLPLLTPANNAGFAFARPWSRTSPDATQLTTPRAIYSPATPPPGAATGELFRDFSTPALATPGFVAFRASVGTSATTPWRAGLWTDRAGSLASVAIAGDPAPGLAADVTFKDVTSEPALTDAGTVVFWAQLQGTSVSASTDQSLWIAKPDQSPTLIVRAGDPAPGVPSAVFTRFTHRVAHADDGSFAFQGFTTTAGPTPTTASGLWRVSPSGVLQPIAVMGQPVGPDLPGVTFRFFQEPRTNAAGRVAFVALLAGPGIADSNNRALFITDPAGRPALLVRAGDTLVTRDGVSRTVRAIAFDDQGVASGRSAFNRSGDLLFRVQFDQQADALFATASPCAADFDRSGGTPDSSDIDAFLAAWLAGEASADIDASGGTPDAADIDAFYTLWLNGGCA